MPRQIGFDQITAWITGLAAGVAFVSLTVWLGNYALARKDAETKKLSEHAQKILGSHPKSESPLPSSSSPLLAKETSETEASKAANFSYFGDKAPWRWMEIDPSWSLCGKGKRQSPIDISGAKMDPRLKPIKFNYQHDKASFFLANNTLQSLVERGSWLEFDADRYDLKQVFFRTPGEHRFNGLPYDMEVQLLHEEISGRKLIVSIQLENGSPHPFINKLVKSLPRFEGETTKFNGIVWSELLPQKRIYWVYSGSMTFPPCSEDVAWLILTSTVRASSSQIAKISALQKDNVRPIQNTNSRGISRSNR